MRRGLAALSVEPRESQSQILPLLIGDSSRCEQLAQRLLVDFGLYLQPINYPTVPRGTERLRITPTALHDDAMIAELLAGLQHCLPARRAAA